MTVLNTTDWPAPPVALALPENEVHVWQSALDLPEESVAVLFALLSPDERGRATRFHFDRHRRSFIAARGFLRHVLARYLKRTPDELAFTYGSRGKPNLAAEDLRFNLSHSGDCAVLAVTRGREVGIDLEKIRPRVNLEGVARRFFAPAEVEALDSVAPGEKELAFFNCWTRKEAFIKATGEGLSRPLDRFEVSLRPGESARLLTVLDDPAEASRWSLCAFASRPGYVGCVAATGHDWELRCWHFPWTSILGERGA
jgi:4'-phosphopantetheinyl transferase